MQEFKYVITDPLGIHARPAGQLVKEASKFTSTVTIKCGEKSVDAKRIMGVMGMSIKAGDEVTICIDGADEDAAFASITEFMKSTL